MSMECYATLAQARTEMKVDTVDDSGDAVLQSMLYFVSARIAVESGRRFWPLAETVAYDARGSHICPYALDTGRDLLEVSTLTNGDDTAIASSAISLSPPGLYPKNRIRLKLSGGVTFTYSDDYEEAVSVAGVWGYHSNYAYAWQATGLTIQGGGINASVTTITLSATTAGADAYGNKPGLSFGNLIKATSGSNTEYMMVLSADGTTITVRRGVNGTTAVSHAAGVAVSVFYPEEPITRATLKWVGYLYSRRGEYTQSSFDGVTTTSFPPDMPAEVEHIVATYRRKELFIL